MAIKTDPKSRPQADKDLILANWQNELDGAHLYNLLATIESDPQRAALLREMADAESRHSKVMEQGLRDLGVRLPRSHRLSFQTRVLEFLARVIGPGAVYPLLQGAEITGVADYAGQDQRTASLASEERTHARTMGQLSSESTAHREHWHRSAGRGSLRAAVFGVSDGLVSNLSLVMGIAGASADARFILLAGLSGLLAGAFSMASGEYVSVKAQRELFERQIELEQAELYVTPDEEREELALIYRAKGMSKIEAEGIANRLSEDKDVELDSLVREELGLDPANLGSPWGAAISSFLAFGIGAVLPVLPYLFGAETLHVGLSLLISGLALFGVGALLSLFTGRGALFSGGRQLAIGAVAAAITFGIGSLIGVSTS